MALLDFVYTSSDADFISNFSTYFDKKSIIDVLDHLKIAKSFYEIIDESDPVKACEESVKLVSSGKADLLMKGLVDTAVILRAVLDKDFGLRTPNRLSHVSIMEIPKRNNIQLEIKQVIKITQRI